jgi:flagellar biosynthesis protein FlhF
MSIKRFFARTNSEAFRQVREMLGPDAVILSNRTVDGGIELLASRHDHISSLIPEQTAAEPEEGARYGATNQPPSPRFSPVSMSERAFGLLPGKEMEARRGEPRNATSANSFSSWTDMLKHVEAAQENVARPQKALSPVHRANKAHPARPLVVAGEGSSILVNGSEAKPHPEPIRTSEPAKRRLARKPPELPASQGESGTDEVDSEEKRRHPLRKTAAENSTRKISSGSSKSGPTPLLNTQRLAEEVTASVIKEIGSMRRALEHQFTLLNWMGRGFGDPISDTLLSRLLDAGFSIRFAHNLLDRISDVPQMQNDEKEALAHVRQFLATNLETIENEDEILEKGGVYALVGPTGVGKTTTTAKLAARCVIRHGVEKLALLTTDGYRIGGHEQLRIYGKILGVPVHPVRDGEDLTATLAELRGKHMVLIDTVGMSQRDEMVSEQVAMFTQYGTQVKRLLLLNASSSLQTLNEVAEAYRGNGLAGAVITKVDEAVAGGCALEAAIRHCLPLYYVSNGQRVPEDLELANPARLVNAALDSSAFIDPLLPDLFLRVARGDKRTQEHWKRTGAPLD